MQLAVANVYFPSAFVALFTVLCTSAPFTCMLPAELFTGLHPQLVQESFITDLEQRYEQGQHLHTLGCSSSSSGCTPDVVPAGYALERTGGAGGVAPGRAGRPFCPSFSAAGSGGTAPAGVAGGGILQLTSAVDVEQPVAVLPVCCMLLHLLSSAALMLTALLASQPTTQYRVNYVRCGPIRSTSNPCRHGASANVSTKAM